MNALIQEKTDKIRTKIPPKKTEKVDVVASIHTPQPIVMLHPHVHIWKVKVHVSSEASLLLWSGGPPLTCFPPPPGLRLSSLSSAQAEACTYLHTLASEMCPVVSKSLLLQTREAADIWFTPPAAATVLVSLSESDLKRLTHVHLRICVQPQCSLG